MAELSHKQFVVLGLVAETPSHAYNINQRIEERGMRDWTAIGKSSIYRIIQELENTKLVDSYLEDVDNRRRKVYTITDYGARVLKEKVYSVIKEFAGKNDEDFYVAFSMLPLLTKEQLIESFFYSIETMKKHKIELEKMLESNQNFPINVSGLFIHPIKILETDILFLEWVIEKISKGDDFDSKIPSE
ncbi:MAG: helix-turn-helix transcriptional regulator [Candidatus Lokiarchaeota archaeon]|nr:helix-turn-helix transcriptional regulator [Candidatus Lokiarchaeota archaeon]